MRCKDANFSCIPFEKNNFTYASPQKLICMNQLDQFKWLKDKILTSDR